MIGAGGVRSARADSLLVLSYLRLSMINANPAKQREGPVK